MSKKLQPLCDLKLYIVETSPSNLTHTEAFHYADSSCTPALRRKGARTPRTRCAVLNQSGYNTLAATLAEAESILRVSEFNLVIVSAWLSEWERGRILAAAGKTPALVLTEVTR